MATNSPGQAMSPQTRQAESMSDYSLEAFFRGLKPRKFTGNQQMHNRNKTVPRAPCPVHQPEHYARYLAAREQAGAGNPYGNNSGQCTGTHNAAPGARDYPQGYGTTAYVAQRNLFAQNSGHAQSDANAHYDANSEDRVVQTGQKKYYAPVGTPEPEVRTASVSSATRGDANRYRRMPEQIVQVAFQDNGTNGSNGMNSSLSTLSPSMEPRDGWAALEESPYPENRVAQAAPIRQAARPSGTANAHHSAAAQGTTASPDLSRPWDVGEFDSDGARIISAEEAARLGMAITPGRSANVPNASHASARSSQARTASRGLFSRQGPSAGNVPATGNPRSPASATSSPSRESVMQGESLVERLAMRSRQNPPAATDTVSRGTSMNTAASQPAGGPGLGAALRDALPGGSLGKSLAGEFRPSNDRSWSANHAVMPVAEFRDNLVTVRNIRYTTYRNAQDYTARYYDATFNLDDIRSIDVIVAPFTGTPSLAHVEASFGFSDGTYIAVSIEGRYEQGESYDPLGGITNQFELIYIVADERDVIRLYTQVNKNEIYLYRLRMTPAEVRQVFLSILDRANKLTRAPEFYHAVSNNCATNLIAHINAGRADAIPRDYRARFPGLIDRLLFERGLLETTETDFKKVRDASQINWLAEKFGDQDEFSLGIRQQLH